MKLKTASLLGFIGVMLILFSIVVSRLAFAVSSLFPSYDGGMELYQIISIVFTLTDIASWILIAIFFYVYYKHQQE